MVPKEKFIAFIDIIGFKDIVERAETVSGDHSLPLELMKILGSDEDTFGIRPGESALCPMSKRSSADLDFRISQASDSALISVEVSPVGIATLAHHCMMVASNLLRKTVLCRGAIVRGRITHEDREFTGTGVNRAIDEEKRVAFRQLDQSDIGTPFIQVDHQVVRYVADETDQCVQTRFERCTRTDGTYVAIYPFASLENGAKALIQPGFDPHKWKATIMRLIDHRRGILQKIRDAELLASDERAKQKVRHYVRGVEQAIDHFRGQGAALDEMIATGRVPYGTVWK